MIGCEDIQTESKSCTYPYLRFSDGKIIKRNTSYFDLNEQCHDCGIENKEGNIHHLRCDVEECPRCKRQLISCDCLSTSKEGYVQLPIPLRYDK